MPDAALLQADRDAKAQQLAQARSEAAAAATAAERASAAAAQQRAAAEAAALEVKATELAALREQLAGCAWIEAEAQHPACEVASVAPKHA